MTATTISTCCITDEVIDLVEGGVNASLDALLDLHLLGDLLSSDQRHAIRDRLAAVIGTLLTIKRLHGGPATEVDAALAAFYKLTGEDTDG